MAVYPGAVWRGNCANNSGPRGPVTRGLVLHVNDGPNVSLWSWVNNPASNMSCHFQVLQDGTVEQYLDTDLWSWCQADGNQRWLSMEMPTHPDTGMTPAQIASGARVLAWASALHDFPLQLTNDPIGGTGLGWHGMGGQAWGGHFGCPGDIRKTQMTELLAATSGNQPQEDDMPYSDWPAKDRQALAGDVATAIVNRPLGGVGYPGTVANILKATLDEARAVQAALDKLPGELEAAVHALPTGATADASAIATALLAKLGLVRA